MTTAQFLSDVVLPGADALMKIKHYASEDNDKDEPCTLTKAECKVLIELLRKALKVGT